MSFVVHGMEMQTKKVLAFSLSHFYFSGFCVFLMRHEKVMVPEP